MKKLGTLSVLIAGILWGCIGLYIHPLNDAGINSMNIVALRTIPSTAGAFIILLIFRRSLLKIRLKDIWVFMGTGWASLLFFSICYFHTISTTSMAVAAVLLYTSPVFVMILSRIIFKEYLTLNRVLSIVLVFIGCVLVTGVVGSSEALSPGAIFIGLGAGLGYALYSIFSRFALKKGYHTFTIMFYTFLFTSLGTFPFADFGLLSSYAFSSPVNMGLIAALCILSAIIPYIAYTVGLKHLENGQAAVIAAAEPVVATILGSLVFKESLTITSSIGIILVIFSIILANIPQNAFKRTEVKTN